MSRSRLEHKFIDGVEHKYCGKCGEWKPINLFTKNKNNWDGLHSHCKECEKEHYKDNKEKILKRNKKYYENNKEKIANYQKEYYENNKEYYKEYGKEYRKNNKEKRAKCQKEYSKTPAGKVAMFNHHNKRRHKNGAAITEEQWLECMKYFGWKDAYTGESMQTQSLDHVIPISKGGSGDIWNLIPCERSINNRKYNNDLEDWYKKQSFFSEERLQKIYEWIEYAYKKYND